MPRYADCPSLEVDLVIAASPHVVWNLISDISLPTRFSPELHRVQRMQQQDTGHEPTVGTTFVGYNQNPLLGEWRTLSTIVEYSPPRAIAWEVADLDGIFGGPVADPSQPLASWRYRLEPHGEDTRLRQSMRIGPARSGLSLAIDQAPDREEEIVAHRLTELRSSMLTTLEGIKALVENEP